MYDFGLLQDMYINCTSNVGIDIISIYNLDTGASNTI